MAKEIERKFLVTSDRFRQEAVKCIPITQGYLCNNADKLIVRVRIAGENATLTIKGAPEEGDFVRNEWEYAIPLCEAKEMLQASHSPRIEKDRYLVPCGEHMWEVDCFHQSLEGLVVAEIELLREDEPFAHPQWIGEEVTHNPEYYNAVLATNGLPSKKNNNITL